MAYCEACENLRDYAPNVILNGITDTECESLQENTGLNPQLSVLHANCEDLHDMVDCLIGGHLERLPAYDICGRDGYSLKDYIEAMMKNLYTMYSALVCSDCGQWAKIEDILIQIEDIYKWLNALSNTGYVRLTQGVDYDLTFYNGFYTNSGNLYVGINESSFQGMFKVTTYEESDGTASVLRNDALNNVLLRHGATIEAVPESRIFGVTFKGNYDWVNSGTLYDTTDPATGIWNIGNATRASWHAGTGTSRQGSAIVTSIATYADGYNDQFSVYGTGLYTGYANHTTKFTIVKSS